MTSKPLNKKQKKVQKTMESKPFSTLGLFKPSFESKPYFGFAKLEPGNYEILKFRMKYNKFHKPQDPESMEKILVAELDDQILYLPEIFARKFKNDQSLVDAVNNDGIKRYLCFRGKTGK